MLYFLFSLAELIFQSSCRITEPVIICHRFFFFFFVLISSFDKRYLSPNLLIFVIVLFSSLFLVENCGPLVAILGEFCA